MVLPAGFTIPPLRYLVPLVVVLLATAWVLWALRPSITDRHVLASVPWMVTGAAGHVLYIVDAIPPWLEPLFGVPAVYLTMGALGAAIWLLAEVTTSARTYHDPALYLFLGGLFCAVFALLAVVSWGMSTGDLDPWWPIIGLISALAVTVVAWGLVATYLEATARVTGWTGVLVVFAHVLDGISTAIGIDILGSGERSPLADAIIYVGSRLPTADFIGDAWVFVLVKLVLPIVILVLFRDYVHERPSQARLLLAIIAAVGLGPGVYNLLLFVVSL